MSNDTRRNVGSVDQLPSGRWRARIAVGVRADGSRRQATKTFDSKSDAEAWLVAQAAEMGKRPDLSAGITLEQVWKLYQEREGERLAKKTMSVYRSQMRTWLAVIGTMDVSLIRPSHVQRVLDTLTHENALHAKRVLSAVLSFAVRMELLSVNPLHGQKLNIPEDAPDEEDYDDDPFAAIEEKRVVWDMDTVLRCLDLIHGLPLEPAWLACVGAGLRVEESMALRPVDVRRTTMAGVEVTQLAVHHASTAVEKRKGTKTKGSVRIVTMLEPFGTRYWELVCAVDDRKAPVCPISASRQNKAWRSYFLPRSIAKHAPQATQYRGTLEELPYVPLSKMRNTHATLMAEAGVLDSINAAMHGHSERIASKHYIKPDTTSATVEASKRLRLVM
jgi:hypothetical protein